MLRVPSLKSAAAAGFSVAVALILTSSPAAAATCKPWGFVGQAVGANQTQTMVLARANWAAKVTAQWDQSWATWTQAASRWERCDPYRRQFRCLANGVPCKDEMGLKAK